MKNLLFYLSFVVFISCGSRDEESSKESADPNGSFTAKIEGVQKTIKNDGNTHYVSWKKGKDDRDRYFYQLGVYGFNQGFYFDYIIYTENIQIGKEYIYQHSSDFGNLSYAIKYSETCDGPYASHWGTTNEFYGTPTGKITITSFDGKVMTGTVEAKVNHQYYGMGCWKIKRERLQKVNL
ncbi:hypothetical protein [Kaistella sp.]|uniref:hypothetical protein n=1 Tax=Kaistella sp. TaxID=2782235 RepID=UPI003C4C3D7A